MSQQDKIIHLRSLIARQSSAPVARRGRAETGLAAVDEALGGGLWKGGIVEMVEGARSAGGATLVRSILHGFAVSGRWSALVDGSDSFDPRLAGPVVSASLLWLRCRDASEAMRSADMVVRDGNLPLIVLDLRDLPDVQLRKVASAMWYRLQRAVEPTETALLVVTPRAFVPCADARIELQCSLPLAALEWEPPEVLRQTTLRVTRKRAPGSFTFGAGGERNLVAEAG